MTRLPLDAAKDRVTLSVWLYALCIGLPLAFLAHAFLPGTHAPYCRSTEPGTAAAWIYLVTMSLCFVPLLIARNFKKHQDLAHTTPVPFPKPKGVVAVMSVFAATGISVPYLLVCESVHAGRAALASRALKSSWISLGLSGAVLIVGIYMSAVIVLFYIPRFARKGRPFREGAP